MDMVGFGEDRVKVDVAATRAFYERMRLFNDCDWPGCRNFRRWAQNSPPVILDFLDGLGIGDLRHAGRITPVGASYERYLQTKTILYVGIYYVTGRRAAAGPGRFAAARRKLMLTEDFAVFLKEGPYYPPPRDFPPPVLGIGIEAQLPWLLDAENIYVFD